MISGQRTGPSPLVWGLIIGIGLILLVSARACSPDSSQVLRSRFAEAGANVVVHYRTSQTPVSYTHLTLPTNREV